MQKFCQGGQIWGTKEEGRGRDGSLCGVLHPTLARGGENDTGGGGGVVTAPSPPPLNTALIIMKLTHISIGIANLCVIVVLLA